MSFVYGLLGGVLAWFITTFFAQPIVRFLGLRAEAAKLMALYEELIYRGPDAPPEAPEDSDWLKQRRIAYKGCGADLIAFASTNSRLTQILHRLGRFRVSPRNAGSCLMSLADTKPGTMAGDQFREQIERQLRLKYRP